MNATLVALGQKAAKALKGYSFIRIISHNDADGITAGAIMSSAIYRSKIVFQTTIVSTLDQDLIEQINTQDYGKDAAVLFCDMGSGQPELVNQIKDDVIIIDHHQIVGEHSCLQVNPHMLGIDGARLLSASGTAYFVASAMGDNADLAGLALTGAIGDKQKMEGPNAEILQDALKAGVVSQRKGLRIPDGPVEDVIVTLVEPYLDITGDREATGKFLKELGVSGQIQDLGVEETVKLASAMALKIAGVADPSVIQSMVGDVIVLNREVVTNIYNLEWMLHCCGKMDQPSLGLALCMRDVSILDEIMRLSNGYQQELVKQIRSAKDRIKEMEHIRYLLLEDATGTGIIGSTLTRYVYPDKPFITLNKTDGIVKVSARGTRRLVENGLDLAAVMRQAAGEAGGQGGGHDVASGASIPPGGMEHFLISVDRIVGAQLG